MISLDQIQLLERKVESAVTKILQLTEERAALFQRCAQLENESQNLRNKLLSFEQDQERIEQGIIKALDRLNVVENSVLQAISAQQEPAAARDDGDGVQTPPDTANINTENAPVPQPQHTEGEVSHSQVSEQIPLQQSGSIGLAPMFSEEIVSENSDSHIVNPGTPSFPESQEDDSLLEEDQDDYDSGQLDIF